MFPPRLPNVRRQWREEIARHVAPGALTVMVYHGPKRDLKADQLRAADVIITTYRRGGLPIQGPERIAGVGMGRKGRRGLPGI